MAWGDRGWFGTPLARWMDLMAWVLAIAYLFADVSDLLRMTTMHRQLIIFLVLAALNLVNAIFYWIDYEREAASRPKNIVSWGRASEGFNTIGAVIYLGQAIFPASNDEFMGWAVATSSVNLAIFLMVVSSIARCRYCYLTEENGKWWHPYDWVFWGNHTMVVASLLYLASAVSTTEAISSVSSQSSSSFCLDISSSECYRSYFSASYSVMRQLTIQGDVMYVLANTFLMIDNYQEMKAERAHGELQRIRDANAATAADLAAADHRTHGLAVHESTPLMPDPAAEL